MSMGGEIEAEVDLGPLVLDAMVGMKASFDSMAKEMKKIRDEEAAYQRGAVSVPLRASQMSDAAGASLIMDMGGPTYGRLWEVRRITVGGALWTSVVSGQGLLIVTSSSGQVTPALYDIADQSPSLPNVALYSSRQLVVRHPNHLFLVILTPTASTQYAAGGEATDLPDRRVPLRTID